MTNFPGPWKIESDRIVASNGSLVLHANRLGEIAMTPEVERLLLAVPKIRELVEYTEGDSRTSRRDP